MAPKKAPKKKVLKSTIPRRAIRKANRKRPASSFELALYEILNEEGIPFQREKTIGRCHADIFIAPRTVLEAQGCYWHKCPKCYPADTAENKKVRTKDGRRIKFFQREGYITVQIWEHELKQDPDKVRFRLRKLVS